MADSAEIATKRCNKCILPDNYPNITFNEEGICNYCISFKTINEKKYLGDKELKDKIEQFLTTIKNRNKNYDCVLGLSGGRDSSYLLYYLVKKLDLKVFAYHVDNGFIPEQTKLNIINATNVLNVKLEIEKIDYLEKCIRHHIASWMQKPSLPMIETFCVGCRYGHFKGLPNCARKNKIPIWISGSNPSAETINYRYNSMKFRPDREGQFNIILGTSLQMIKNPKIFLNGTCLITQMKEYLYFFDPLQKIKKRAGLKSKILRLDPFATYIKWEEKEVISKIEKQLKWEKNPKIESTWRGDCDIALLKLYLYKEILGFNDKDEGLSNLIRINQMTREEALIRLKKETEIPEEIITNIFNRLGLNFSKFKDSIEIMKETIDKQRYS
jgi:hypothetical protein